MHELLTMPLGTGNGVRRSISVEVAARLVGCSPSTVRRALQRGDLQGYRAGARGIYRIPPTALEDWLRPAHNPQEKTS